MTQTPAHLPAVLRPVVVGAAIQSPAGTPVEIGFRLTGNTGNMAFSHAIQQALLGGDAPSFRMQAPASGLAQCDVVVLPCANFLTTDTTPGVVVRTQLVQGYQRPMVAIGLGAQAEIHQDGQTLHADVLTFLRTLAERSPLGRPNISVRGEFTRRVVEAAGFGQHIEVLGCPSLFLNPSPDLGQQIQRRFDAGSQRMSVGGWSKNIPAALEAGLARLAQDTDGIYIAQHPIDLAYFMAGQADKAERGPLLRMRQFITPGMDNAQSDAWAMRYGRVFFNVPDWMDAAAQCDGFLGCRIHGTMFSLQAGVPAVCIAHDSRTLELCEIMKLPHVRLQEAIEAGASVDNFRRWFARSFDPQAFNHNRLHLGQRTLDFLRNNGIVRPHSPLTRLVAAGQS